MSEENYEPTIPSRMRLHVHNRADDCMKLPDCPQAHIAAKQAVREVFAILGVDVDNPEKVEEFRMDLRTAGSVRKAADRGVLALIGLIVVAAAGAAWAGMVYSIRGH